VLVFLVVAVEQVVHLVLQQMQLLALVVAV
jgi:hypothetical protein